MPMASSRFLSPHPLLFLFLFLFILIFSSATTPLFYISNNTPLALNCTQSLKPTTNNQTGTLLESLTANITLTRFTTGSIGHERNRLTGLMQCRFDLSANSCRLCIQAAKQTVTSLCPNTNAVAAWFDGCYINYHWQSLEIRVFNNRSNQAYARNRAGFDSALNTLLMRLRAGVRISSRRGFYTGSESYYGPGRPDPDRVYALVECLRSVSPENCDTCVAEGIERVYDCCGGKEGGVVVVGSCVVRFESYRFFGSSEVVGGSDSGESDGGYEERESGGGFVGWKKNKIASVWGIGVALVIGVGLGVWLLRRRVVFSKVGMVHVEISEEK